MGRSQYLRIISCRTCEIELPLPVLPQPATKYYAVNSAVLSTLTCSNLVFIEIIGIVRQTDWSHTGVRVETDWSLELQQTDVIIQIAPFLVLRMDFDLIKYNILQKWKPSSLDLADSSPEVFSFITKQPVVVTEIDLEIARSLSIRL